MKEQLPTIQTLNPKIDEYVERIKSGASKVGTLQGLPQSWISAVEEKLGGTPEASPQEELEAAAPVIPIEAVPDPEIVVKQKEEKLTKEQEQIDSLREQLGIISKTSQFEGLENIKAVLEKVGQTHYLFTHQTEEGVAQDIFNSQFHVSPGTGISSTMTWLGPETVLNQIQRQMDGDAHRGYKGMLIVAVPKELLDKQGGRNKAEALSDYLLESPEYGKDGTSDLVIPKEYNLGYLQGSALKVSSNFVESQNSLETSKDLEPVMQEINDLLQSLGVLGKKSKEIINKTENEWYERFGRNQPLDNKRYESMRQQSFERILDWMNYESGNSADQLVGQYNEIIDSLSTKYELGNIRKLEITKSLGRSSFDESNMKRALEELQENIKNGIKTKQVNPPNPPKPMTDLPSWFQV